MFHLLGLALNSETFYLHLLNSEIPSAFSLFDTDTSKLGNRILQILAASPLQPAHMLLFD